MLRDCYAEMAVYYTRLKHSNSSLNLFVLKEVLARLRQLAWLYAQCVDREDRVMRLYEEQNGAAPPRHTVVAVFSNFSDTTLADATFTIPEQLCVLTEAFYECAFRLLTLLDECKDNLPGLGAPAAKGIRRVRNNLYVHANKPQGTSLYTFSVSNTAGVRLRPASIAGLDDPYTDEGLRINAQEFSAQLLALLRTANAA